MEAVICVQHLSVCTWLPMLINAGVHECLLHHVALVVGHQPPNVVAGIFPLLPRHLVAKLLRQLQRPILR